MKILLKAGDTVVCHGDKYHCNSRTNVLCVSIFVIIDAYLLEFPSQNVPIPSSNTLGSERDI